MEQPPQPKTSQPKTEQLSKDTKAKIMIFADWLKEAKPTPFQILAYLTTFTKEIQNEAISTGFSAGFSQGQKAAGKKYHACQSCGIALELPRDPIFVTNSLVGFAAAKAGECEECGHQKTGWTLRSLQDRYALIHKQAQHQTAEEIFKELEKLANECDKQYCCLELIGDDIDEDYLKLKQKYLGDKVDDGQVHYDKKGNMVD